MALTLSVQGSHLRTYKRMKSITRSLRSQHAHIMQSSRHIVSCYHFGMLLRPRHKLICLPPFLTLTGCVSALREIRLSHSDLTLMEGLLNDGKTPDSARFGVKFWKVEAHGRTTIRSTRPRALMLIKTFTILRKRLCRYSILGGGTLLCFYHR